MELNAEQKKLKSYIYAACNLYGVIHMRNLIDLLRHYEGLSVTRSELQEKTKGMFTNKTIIGYENGFFWNRDVFCDFEDAVSLYQEQKSKPYYKPDKKEFMKYVNSMYYEKTPFLDQLSAFLEVKISEDSYYDKKMRMKHLLQEVVFMIQGSHSMTDVMHKLIDHDIDIVNEQELREFGNLMMNVCNHTRMLINHGFTPDELARQYRSSQFS